MSTAQHYAIPVTETGWTFDGKSEGQFTWEYDEGRAALLGLAACASTPPDQGPSKLAATETQQWMDRIKVDAAPDEILLKPHASGLSANQSAALEALMAAPGRLWSAPLSK